MVAAAGLAAPVDKQPFFCYNYWLLLIYKIMREGMPNFEPAEKPKQKPDPLFEKKSARMGFDPTWNPALKTVAPESPFHNFPGSAADRQKLMKTIANKPLLSEALEPEDLTAEATEEAEDQAA